MSKALIAKKNQGWTCRNVLDSDDVGKITDLVQECGNFRQDEIEIATELAQEHLTQGVSSGYEFLLLEKADILGAFACWGPVSGSVGSYDLYWLAVAPDFQGAGLGTLLFKKSIQHFFLKAVDKFSLRHQAGIIISLHNDFTRDRVLN